MEHISNLHYYCVPVLPLVYDESLSYYETLGKVVDKLNNVIDDYNVLITYYNSLADLLNKFQNDIATQNAKISQMQKDITTMRTDIESFKSEVRANFTALEANINKTMGDLETRLTNRVEAAVTAMQQQLTSLSIQLQRQIDSALLQIDGKLEEQEIRLWKELDIKFQKFVATLPDVQQVLVNDPVYGDTVTIETMIKRWYELLQFEAITCGEYDGLAITCGQYDTWNAYGNHSGLKCIDYDLRGKYYLMLRTWEKVYHPATGERVGINEVVDFNTTLERKSGAFTCEEYDEEDYTCEEWDNLQLTCFLYDWQVNRKVV